jgi:hypothetical protein
MKKFIYDSFANKKIPVRSIKDFTHPKHPKYKFFVHRQYKGDGEFMKDSFIVTETTTGCAVSNYGLTVKAALDLAIKILNGVSRKGMEVAIAKARLRLTKGGK